MHSPWLVLFRYMRGDEDIQEEVGEAGIFRQDPGTLSARDSMPVERVCRHPGHRYTQEPS